MRIAVLSDLHIKDNSFGNRFMASDLEFSNLLRKLSNKFDAVVLNGDIFELWKSELPFFSLQDEEFEKIRKQYPRTLQAMQAHNVVLIMGNHDNVLKKLSNQFPELSKAISEIMFVNNQGEHFLFWHGHLDLFNRWIPGIGFFFTWIASVYERLFMPGTSDYKGFAGFFKKPFFRNSTQRRNFKKRIRKMKSLVFVANGHTHHEEIVRFKYKKKERIYLNTGYYNKISPVYVIDLDTKNIEKI